MLGSLVALLLAAIAPSAGAPGDAAAVPARAVRAPGEITDDVWRTAPAVDAFVQREPEEGGRPSQRTEFRVVYDASTLFVRVHAFDTDPSRIVSYLTRRDDESPSDWIRVMVDSYHDRRTAFEFAVNPAGVKRDYYEYDDSREDITWDAVWDVATRIDSLGWTAEFKIPLSQIRYPHAAEHTFGIMIMRDIT